jgi:branched-chain amino acid transport system permease protein
MFGVMRLVNLAHGDLGMLAAFAAVALTGALGINPFVSLLLVVPLMFALGYVLQRGVLNFTLGGNGMPPLLVTFGLSIIIQNLLLEVFSADSRRLRAGPIENLSIPIGSQLAIGWLPLITFAAGVIVLVTLQLMLSHTQLGRLLRATSDDREAAQLAGIDSRHVYALATAIALAVVGIAGVFLGIRTTFTPSIGPARLLYAFEAVVIGGLGSLWGTLVGGAILGIAQTIGGQVSPAWSAFAGHVVFLAVLALRPRGLFARR